MVRGLARRLAARLDRRYVTRAELTRLLAAQDQKLAAREAELAARSEEVIAQANARAEKLTKELAEARHRAEQAYWLAWDVADAVERLLQADLRIWQAIDKGEGDRAGRMD